MASTCGQRSSRPSARTAPRTGGGLGDETISVVLFADGGLEKTQQKSADLNRFGVRLNGSLSLLHAHRDELASLPRAVVYEVALFAKPTDREKTSILHRVPPCSAAPRLRHPRQLSAQRRQPRRTYPGWG
ncbi:MULTISPECIES: DNA sulfur modification protein DndB [Sorangium]|uniref:DNA sulfur modification protein DndB n=1 Tax=Sorangium TaxID=39643 RepID=UPI003D9C1E08